VLSIDLSYPFLLQSHVTNSKALNNLRPIKNASRYSGINHPDNYFIGTGIHTLSILRIALKLHFVQNVESDIPPVAGGHKGTFFKGLSRHMYRLSALSLNIRPSAGYRELE